MSQAGAMRAAPAAAGQPTIRWGSSHAPLGVVLCGIGVALVTLLPLDLLLVQSASAGWTRVEQLLFRPLVGTLLINTALITVTATAAASVLGVGVAWCVERTDLPGRRIWGVLA